MNSVTKKRKIQMMEYPTVNTIKKYDNFQGSTTIIAPRRITKPRVETKTDVLIKKQVAGVNRMRVVRVSSYILIFLAATMLKMWMTYEVSNLGVKKTQIEKNLNEVKLEVQRLEDTYISNFDLKQVEQKSKDLGFVYNDKVEYIKIK